VSLSERVISVSRNSGCPERPASRLTWRSTREYATSVYWPRSKMSGRSGSFSAATTTTTLWLSANSTLTGSASWLERGPPRVPGGPTCLRRPRRASVTISATEHECASLSLRRATGRLVRDALGRYRTARHAGHPVYLPGDHQRLRASRLPTAIQNVKAFLETTFGMTGPTR
jgi:hypothetical protein